MKKKLFQMAATGLMALALAACSAGSGQETAQNGNGGGAADTSYPERTIEFIIPFGAGGSADIFARSFADLLAKETGVNVTPDNKPGAGGVTGLTYVADQDADGYTLCLVTPSMPIAQAKGTFDFTGEFRPVALMEMDIYVIAMLDSNPKFSDWDSFVSYVREHPGDVTTGGSGSGSLDEYEAIQLGEHIGGTLTYVPYDGYGEYKAAVLGGEVDLYVDKLSSYTQMMQYDEIVPLAVVNAERIDVEGLSDVPTTVELGIDFTTGSWRGIVVRKDTPEAVVQRLQQLCETIHTSDAFQEVLVNDNADVVDGYKNEADFQALIDAEVEKYTDIVNRYER